MPITKRFFGSALALALSVTVAHAGNGCDGTIVATQLHPLPAHSSVTLDITDDSPENRDLGTRFMDGLRSAGVNVAAPSSGAALHLSLRTTILSRERIGGGRADFRAPADRGWDDFGWGRNDPSSYNLQPRAQAGANQIAVRAELSEAGSVRPLWVASVQCRQNSSEPREVAFGLGQVIGGVFGRQVSEPQRF